MRIDRIKADAMARRVFDAACGAIDDNEAEGLPAFAYAERALEVWLVLETYKRIFIDLDNPESPLCRPDSHAKWSSWPEVLLPGQKQARSHIDLFVGPYEPFVGKEEYGDYYSQPCEDAPVFEFKFLRWDNLADGLTSVVADVDKITSKVTCLRHGYAVLLYLMEKPDDVPLDAATARDDRLEILSPGCLRKWSGDKPGLNTSFCFRLEMLRMNRRG